MIGYKRIIISIVIMAVVTYLLRVLPLIAFKKKITNQFVKSFLAYIPYGVMAAMVFPTVLYSTGNMVSAIAGFLTAVILAYFNKGLLTVILSSTIVALVIDQCILLLA